MLRSGFTGWPVGERMVFAAGVASQLGGDKDLDQVAVAAQVDGGFHALGRGLEVQHQAVDAVRPDVDVDALGLRQFTKTTIL